jgi:hypothetical protein
MQYKSGCSSEKDTWARLERKGRAVAGGFVRTPYYLDVGIQKAVRCCSIVHYCTCPLSGRVRLRLAGNGQVQKWRYARTIRLSQCEMMGTVRLCRYQNGGVV